MYNQFAKTIPDNAHNRRIMSHFKEMAEDNYQVPLVSLPYTKFRMFVETGNRTEYEEYYFEHRRMYAIYGLMCLWENDDRWMSKLCDCIWAICDEYTWVLPAHIKASTQTETNIAKIDLFSGETAMALAEMFYILGDRLPEMVRDRIVYELERRIVQPYVKGRSHWPANNWSAVCGGTVGAVLIYLGKDREFEEVKENLLQSMQTFLDSFTDDGCCLEGGIYWGYGFSYFCFFAELLREYTEGAINFFEQEKVRKIAYFGQNITLQDDQMISFSDSPHQVRFNCGLWHLLDRKYPGMVIPNEKWESRFGDDHGDSKRYRFAQLIRNLFWYRAPEERTKPLFDSSENQLVYYENSGWYINKKHSYGFAAKAGHNHEPHNHNDVGSFILFDGGKYILDDVGWPEYDKNYFTARRYENMCASSLGHSVPIAGGPQQAGGAEYAGIVLEVTENMFTIDLAPVYHNEGLISLERQFILEKDGVRIVDHPQGKPGKYVERFVTRIRPVVKDNKVIIDEWEMSCAQTVRIELSSFDYEPRFERFSREDYMETAYLIDFIPDEPQKLEFKIKRADNV